MTCELRLVSGSVVLVSEGDLPNISRHGWHLSDNGYVIRRVRENGRKRMVYMHREVFGEAGALVDHINGNKLDNRRENLRLATKSQNGMNSRKRENCSSQFKGVCFSKQIRRWIAYITKDGRRKHVGSFGDEKTAARAYNQAALAEFGEFARINQIA